MIERIKTVDDFKNNAIKLKEEYEVFLDSSFLDIKSHIRAKRYWKNKIYELETKPYLKYFRDLIWNYLNDDLSYIELINLLGRK